MKKSITSPTLTDLIKDWLKINHPFYKALRFSSEDIDVIYCSGVVPHAYGSFLNENCRYDFCYIEQDSVIIVREWVNRLTLKAADPKFFEKFGKAITDVVNKHVKNTYHVKRSH